MKKQINVLEGEVGISFVAEINLIAVTNEHQELSGLAGKTLEKQEPIISGDECMNSYLKFSKHCLPNPSSISQSWGSTESSLVHLSCRPAGLRP